MHVFLILLCGLLVVVQATPAAEPAPKPDAPASAPADAAPVADEKAPAKPEAAPASEAPVATAVPEDKGLPGREGEIVPRLPEFASEEELVWLNADGGRFFAFRRSPANGLTLRGAMLIVSDPEAFIDQQAVTRALREIPARGAWQTLALQVPLAAAPAAPPGAR